MYRGEKSCRWNVARSARESKTEEECSVFSFRCSVRSMQVGDVLKIHCRLY
jgi:hypothetical protein